MEKNDKTEYLQVAEDVCTFAGALVGAAVVAGKEIQVCVRNLMAAKPEPELKAEPAPSAKPKKQVQRKSQGASGKKNSPE